MEFCHFVEKERPSEIISRVSEGTQPVGEYGLSLTPRVGLGLICYLKQEILGRTMRTRFWIFLFCSFLFGLAGAFATAFYTFDAKPIKVYDPGPTVKILVTKRAIPSGAEVTAEAIAFEDAPVAELPEKVLTDFNQVYRRRAALPIPAGYPLCEDFLLAQNNRESADHRYLPTGSQLVSLEIEKLRQGTAASETSSAVRVSISELLSPEQKIAIRAIPRNTAQGIFARKRDQLLRTHGTMAQSQEDGELILENIAIHRIEGKTSTGNGPQVQTLSLILKDEEVEKLMAAARTSRLRVVPIILGHGMESTKTEGIAVAASHGSADVQADVLETQNGPEPEFAAVDTPSLVAPAAEKVAAEKPATEKLVFAPVVQHAENLMPRNESVPTANRTEAVISFFSPTIIYSNRTAPSEMTDTETETITWRRPTTTTEQVVISVTQENTHGGASVSSPAPPPSTRFGQNLISEGTHVGHESTAGELLGTHASMLQQAAPMAIRYSPFDTRNRLAHLHANQANEEAEHASAEEMETNATESTTTSTRPMLRSRGTGSTYFR